jgi:hypothetical protein
VDDLDLNVEITLSLQVIHYKLVFFKVNDGSGYHVLTSDFPRTLLWWLNLRQKTEHLLTI